MAYTECFLRSTDPLTAEAKVALGVAHLAMRMERKREFFEGDNLQATGHHQENSGQG